MSRPALDRCRALALALAALAWRGPAASAQQAPATVQRVGAATSSILAGVAIPAGRATYHTSGIVAPMLDRNAAPGTRERYGDTRTQGIGILRRIEEQLRAQGLGLPDVVFVRVYVAPDPLKSGAIDFQGWFDAYAQFFNNAENPAKVARSTIGVARLVDADMLIEIEAVAVYPQ